MDMEIFCTALNLHKSAVGAERGVYLRNTNRVISPTEEFDVISRRDISFSNLDGQCRPDDIYIRVTQS